MKLIISILLAVGLVIPHFSPVEAQIITPLPDEIGRPLPEMSFKEPLAVPVLTEKPLLTPAPTPAAVPRATPPATKTPAAPKRKTIPGNTYTAGQCTWYAKSRRPDLPNNLGNANTWYARAAAQGYAVGSTPRVGAIGMTRAYMHVVYIEKVNANGTVTVSEMNYRGNGGGPFRVSPRTTSASEFVYIY